MRNQRTYRTRAAACGAVLLLAGVLSGCEAPQAPAAPPPVAVSSLEVAPRELPLTLEHAAQLTGVREVEVRSRVSGILLERLYEEGSAVQAGDVLFRIDPAPFRAEAERARAELGLREANLRQAERERERILPLFDQGLASQRDRDNAVAGYETSLASVAAAQAQLRAAELELSYTDVRAPIDGLTSQEVRSEGSLVTAGSDSSLLAYIVQADRLYVVFAVPDAEAQLLREALAEDEKGVGVRVIGVRGTAVGEKARIEFISPRVDDATGTTQVRALLDNKKGALVPGQVARARIEGVGVTGALVIPKRAVMQGVEGPYVWRIDDADTVAAQPVEIGVTAGNDAAVVSGLGRGDRIVVDGILKVQPGARVAATPIAAAAEGAAPAARASQ